MLDLLSKKLTETQGKIVTTADVMDLISKRAISYEMVEEILNDLTDAGGMFYNMQVKQSQTLFGMWSKLGDAAAIMYDQIGNTESVNAGMKTLIQTLEALMRNWKDTARVLDVVGVSLITYAAVLKGTELATTRLTGVTALLNLAHKQQVIQTPKIVAAIIGQNAATRLSTSLTKAHTGAVLRQATANTLLAKGFWKLTAAMLANPWVAVAAAIAGVTAALIHFVGNTETATERAEKLNDSVAALKNLEDTTKPLIDTYNELINKTERTAEEQKKLSQVTHELAKQYPGAITAIGDFGNEVDLVADKLNDLYQAEKEARMDQLSRNLKKTEVDIAEVEREIENLQAQLAAGGRTIEKFKVEGAISVKTGETEFIPFTDADKDRILQRITDLNKGVGENKGLIQLKQDAENARRALGLIPTEAAAAIEKFGAWKKTFTTFRQQVGDVRVQLFDDSTINQFGSLDEALKKTAEEYKKNIALVKTYDDTLKSTTLTAEERAKIETERAEADAMANLAEKALEYYNALSLLNTTSGGGARQSDPRLGILQEMVSTLKQVNKEYDELAKKEGAAKAMADTQRVYADTFRNMQELARKYKFDLPDFGVPTDTATLTKYLSAIKDAMARLPKSDKAVLGLQVDIERLDIDEQQKKIEAGLKELSERISRTKAAREFYDRILGSTGDYDLASDVTVSVYGDTGEDLQAQMAENIRQMLSGYDIEIPVSIVGVDNSIDYLGLEKFVQSVQEELGGVDNTTYKELMKIAHEGQQNLAKTYEGYLKDLEKAKAYSDERIELARYTANKIAEIEASSLPQGEKKRLTDGYREREAREAAKIEWEAFKEMPIYVQMFDDLDSASTSMLENMKARIEGMQGAWKDLDPTQLKELQGRLSEIDAQLAQRNPFKTLASSIKEYKELQRAHGSEDSLTKEIDAATEAYMQAKANLQAQLEKDPNDAKAVENLQKRVNLSEEELKQLQKIADAYKKVKDAIKLSLGDVFKIAGSLGDLAAGIGKLTETFGGSEEDVQYWNDLAAGIGEVTSGVQSLVDSILSLNVAGIISSAVTAIPNMISGFFNIFSAGRVRKANKEIRRQQELLDQLEYTYGRLEKAAEKAFGGDYISNFKQQQKNLQAQAAAYQKQAAAERSKGKKADKDKIKEYEDAYRDTMDKIADMQGQIAAQMLGTDLTSAARDFAKAWLEAYKEFGNTADKMGEKFREMIENMIVEGAMAKVMERALKPMFDMIDEMGEQDFYSESFWRNVASLAEQGAQQADAGASTLMKFLEQAGISIRDLGGDMTGISRDIATASEESINGLAAHMNTVEHYVALIQRDTAAMAMNSGATGAASAIPSVDYTPLIQQSLQNQNMMIRYQDETLKEIKAQTALFRKVIMPNGVKGSHQVNVAI